MLRKAFTTTLVMVSTSVFSFGGVVTDPQSYTYYVKQLEQGIEQLEVAEEKVRIATDTYDKMVSLDENVSGNVQRASNYLGKIKDLQDLSSKDLKKSIKYTTKALEEIEDIPMYQKDIESGINDVFGIENDKRNDWVSVEAAKRANRQEVMKQAILDAEVAQGKADLQLETLEDLTVATNGADSLKDSTDVANTILLEMLSNQRELINLVANISKNIAIVSYEGDEDREVSSVFGKDLLNEDDWKPKKSGDSRIITGCKAFDKSCTPEMPDFGSLGQ